MANETTPHVPLATQVTEAELFDLMANGLGLQSVEGDPYADPLTVELNKLALTGLRNVAGGLQSNDPTRRAKAERTYNALAAQRTGETVAFGDSPYSAEELRGGLMGLLANAVDLEGPVVDRVRSAFHVTPAPHELPEEEQAFAFTPEEATVASALIFHGLGIADEVEKRQRVIKPNTVWSDAFVRDIQDGLAGAGALAGESEAQKAVVDGVRAKLMHRLETTLKANKAVERKAPRDLSKMPSAAEAA